VIAIKPKTQNGSRVGRHRVATHPRTILGKEDIWLPNHNLSGTSRDPGRKASDCEALAPVLTKNGEEYIK